MMDIRSLVLIIICAFPGIACSSQTINENKKPAQSIQELQSHLENVLKNMHVPGMSVAIVNRDGPIWVAGLGKADLINDRAATAATLFRIGSVSKGFVSLAILMLADEGKLSLEDSVYRLAPEVWFKNKWEATDPVRVVHLLENTTGWDDMHLREFAKEPSTTMSSFEALDYDHSSRISRWRPGTRMAYCNSGPAVAAYIVEKITGKNFEEYVGQKLFKPIGMQTGSYTQPPSELTTTLYHSDGKTPYPYWNLLYHSVGSINASANDMASYLLFYLNRGNAHSTQVMPATVLNRIEVSSTTWAAKEGLPIGYGLNNYCTIYDGFIYHGHDGNIPGGLTAMQYMPDKGIGYFYSINADNRMAFDAIGAIIRAYITHQLQRPPIASEVSLPEKINTYSGWYEPNSPRVDLFFFLERLIGKAYIHFQDNKLLINSFEKNAAFIPVADTEFRYIPINEHQDPKPTLKLLSNSEGQFIQLSLGLRNAALLHVTMKRIPTWLAIFEIIITLFVLLALISILAYSPFLILQGLRRKRRCLAERNILLWPMVAMVSLVSIIIICVLPKDIGVVISRLGNLTVWSFFLFLATITFAAASVASVIALWRTPKGEVRTIVSIYSTVITLALVITTAYLAYWGIIGLRTWA